MIVKSDQDVLQGNHTIIVGRHTRYISVENKQELVCKVIQLRSVILTVSRSRGVGNDCDITVSVTSHPQHLPLPAVDFYSHSNLADQEAYPPYVEPHGLA